MPVEIMLPMVSVGSTALVAVTLAATAAATDAKSMLYVTPR
jgi:hypothetical protein